MENEEIGEQEIDEDLDEEFDEGIKILLMETQTLIQVLHQSEGDEGHIERPLTRRRITTVGYDYIHQALNEDPAIFRQDCIGAIDGTHIPAIVRGCDVSNYRNRRGNISKNVLASCNFDLEFMYVLRGWEGSAHDSKVLSDALSRRNGKHFLVDCGFANRRQFLAPFRGVRYHLQDFAGHGRDLENENELFNLRHASLRNVIERIFGIFKSRFTIFKSAPPFLFNTQAELVLACATLHNFLRKECRSDEFPIEPTDESSSSSSSPIPVDEEDNFEQIYQTQDQQREDANTWRASIASAMLSRSYEEMKLQQMFITS
ncbi:PREDICTED: putative nuclease HARBI1 [Prunus mume]|uniref:Nuclease HARBI1 n=1 Tax=Prunus mume TaxID=102107 RepID=A0ABM0NYK8_PRUMU|nr:PREDICTED: putative nuclease HARBI1 [Prunus mume]